MQLLQLFNITRSQLKYFHKTIVTLEQAIVFVFLQKRWQLVCLAFWQGIVKAMNSWLAEYTPVGILVGVNLFVELN